MQNIMQLLFDYTLDHTHEAYCLQISSPIHKVYQKEAIKKLEEQLTEEQRELFNDYVSCTNELQLDELYAMFLAAFDLSSALFHGHMT